MAGEGAATHVRFSSVHSTSAAQSRQGHQFMHQLPSGHQKISWGGSTSGNSDLSFQVASNNVTCLPPTPGLDLGPIAAQLEFIISYFADRGQNLSLSEALQVAIELKAQEANEDARQRYLLLQRQQQQQHNINLQEHGTHRQFHTLPSSFPGTSPSSASSNTTLDITMLSQGRVLTSTQPASHLSQSDLSLSDMGGRVGNMTGTICSGSHSFGSGASAQQMAMSNAALSSPKMGAPILQSLPAEQTCLSRSLSPSAVFGTASKSLRAQQPSLSGNAQDVNLYNLFLSSTERDALTTQQSTTATLAGPHSQAFNDLGSLTTTSSDQSTGMHTLEHLGSSGAGVLSAFANISAGTGGSGCSAVMNLQTTPQHSGTHSALAAMAAKLKYTPISIPGSSYFPSSSPRLSPQERIPLPHDTRTLPPIRNSTKEGSPSSAVSSLRGLVSYSGAQSPVDPYQRNGYVNQGMLVSPPLEGQGAASGITDRPLQHHGGALLHGTGLPPGALLRASSLPGQVPQPDEDLAPSPWALQKAAACANQVVRQEGGKLENCLPGVNEDPLAWEQFLRESFPDQSVGGAEPSVVTTEKPLAGIGPHIGCQVAHETSSKSTGVVKRCASLPSLVSIGRSSEKEGRAMRGAAAREDMGGAECFSRKVTLRAEAGTSQADVQQVKVEQTEHGLHNSSHTAVMGVAGRSVLDPGDCMPSMFDLGNETFASLGPVVDGVGELFDQVGCDGGVGDLLPLEMSGSPESQISPVTMRLEESLLSGAIGSELGNTNPGVKELNASEHYAFEAADGVHAETTRSSGDSGGKKVWKRKRNIAEDSGMAEPLSKKVAGAATGEHLLAVGRGVVSATILRDDPPAANTTAGPGGLRTQMKHEDLVGQGRRPPTSDPHSVAARQPGELLENYCNILQKLLPVSIPDKLDTASLLMETIEYVKHLQLQIRLLSVKLSESMEEGAGEGAAVTAGDSNLVKHNSERPVPVKYARAVGAWNPDVIPSHPLAPDMAIPAGVVAARNLLSAGNASALEGSHGRNEGHISCTSRLMVTRSEAECHPTGTLPRPDGNCTSGSAPCMADTGADTRDGNPSPEHRVDVSRLDSSAAADGKFVRTERAHVSCNMVACAGQCEDCNMNKQEPTKEAASREGSSGLTAGFIGESKQVPTVSGKLGGAGAPFPQGDATPVSRTWALASPRVGNGAAQCVPTSNKGASRAASVPLLSRSPAGSRQGGLQPPS